MKDYAGKQVSTLFVLAFALIFLSGLTHICQSRSIDDLEQRVTTFETIRIEYVAPPEGVSP